MAVSLRRVKALFIKEMRDFIKNPNIAIIIFVPLVFALVMSSMATKSNYTALYVINQCIGINLSAISVFSIAMLIAEEKEKNTLRTLSLSGVLPHEFLLGKCMLIFLVTTFINGIILVMLKCPQEFIGQYMIYSSLVNISMILIGSMVGLLSSNQMSTGIWGTPVLFIMYLIPGLSKSNKTFEVIAKYLPNTNLSSIMEKVFEGRVSEGITFEVAVILAWIVISLIIFQVVYRKRGIDK